MGEVSTAQSEANYRSLFECAGVANCEVDIRTERFVRVNQRFCDLLGYTSAELLGGLTWIELTHPDDREWNLELVTPFRQGRESFFEVDKRYLRKDGSIVWVHMAATLLRDASGTPYSLVGSAYDITHRKVGEEEQRVGNHRYRLLVDTMLQGVVHQNDAGEIIAMNPAAERILGWRLDGVLGRTSEDLDHGTILPDGSPFPGHRHPAMQALKTGQAVSAVTMGVFNPQVGEYRWISVDAVPIFTQREDKPSEVYTVFEDITERRRVEAELLATEAALRESDRRKDVFLATLSHELRNPLAPIRTAAHLLGSPALKPAQLAWAQGVIQRQVKNMALLLDDLLDIARITQGKLVLKPERVPLVKIVESALETARPLIDEKRHHLTIELPPNPVEIDADPMRMSQVLSNLLTNAAKYTDAGGHIGLAARIESRTLHIAVRDSGIGIPAEALQEIFRMFAQIDSATSRADGGLGIGLALVKGIVDLHDGRIEASSGGAGMGSEFRVLLPLPS
jgi:PAS domain S-box-containing protein